MIVSELIAELQKMPQHKQVHVVLSTVATADEQGDWDIELNDGDALEADQVLVVGAHVLIRSL